MTGITYLSSATNSFSYNGLGLRVSKNDSAGAFAYVCDGTDVASAVLKDGKANFTPGLSERRRTVSKFTHKDALGSTRGITNTSQSTTDAILYDAFGMTVSRTGTTPTPFGFVGGAQYQTDADSGLMLLGHRYYDACIGRFISEDPIQAGDNWYAYCENNPLNDTDETGLQSDARGKPVGYEPTPGPKGEPGTVPIYKDGSRGEWTPNDPRSNDPRVGHDRGRNVRPRGGEEHGRRNKGPQGPRRWEWPNIQWPKIRWPKIQWPKIQWPKIPIFPILRGIPLFDLPIIVVMPPEFWHPREESEKWKREHTT